LGQPAKAVEGYAIFFRHEEEVLHGPEAGIQLDGNEEFLCYRGFKDAVAHAEQFAD